MDFFEHQDNARRNTKRLVAYFVLAVVLIIAAVYAVTAAIFLRDAGSFWNPTMFEGVALITILVIVAGSLWKSAELRGGGAAVATMLGGRLVDTNTSDGDERKVLNVVEEMAIAAGIAVPQVYLLADEAGINAFAAGMTPAHAVIGVTRGAATHLTRDELQGVIAHEFSHILNGDMRLNVRLIGLVFGIFCLAELGRLLFRTSGSRRGERKGGNPLPILGLALLIIGWIGVLFGRLIRSAVSRQREFLADAAAVQFTRNPEGLAGALKKIGGIHMGSRLQSAHAEEASHLFFADGLASAWSSAMSTHPPLVERIRRLDSNFDGVFPKIDLPPRIVPVMTPTMAAFAEVPRLRRTIPADAVAPLIGAPTPAQIVYAAEFQKLLSPTVAMAAHEPMSAAALVYAILLSPEESTRSTQIEQLQAQAEPALVAEAEKLRAEVAELGTAYRLPLVQLAMPALTRLSEQQFADFQLNLQLLIECDARVDLFEYALQKMVRRHLESRFGPQRPPVIQFYSLRPLLRDCSVLLSMVAHSGQSEPSAAQRAFACGAQRFGNANPLTLIDLSSCTPPEVDAALERLAEASPAIKKAVIEACARTAATDGKLETHEAELLRAIADALDCPIPPFIGGI